jgi:ubiquinone/menaquinone biosynthesis C-methylase UbiE
MILNRLLLSKSVNRAFFNLWSGRQKAEGRTRNISREILQLHLKNWKTETAEHATDLQKFLSWFDTAKSSQESYMSGWWDFSFHILKPELVALLGEPCEKTALEIGYGAGRLLVPACHYFRYCVGIDIHPFTEKVEELMREQGVTNFTLYQTDGFTIPLDSESTDLVYSFIVLQHLPTIESLQDYLAEIYRVLKLGAISILYMGFLPGRFRKRYLDLSTQSVSTTRQVTLQLTIPLSCALLSDAGFQIVDVRRSKKKPWRADWGGQFYAIIRK